jgi:phage-related minor tail protein
MGAENRSISKDNWKEFEAIANKHKMNRSEFDDYLFKYWKKYKRKPTRIELFTLFSYAFILIIILVVK